MDGGSGRFDEAKPKKFKRLEQQREGIREADADIERALEGERASPLTSAEGTKCGYKGADRRA